MAHEVPQGPTNPDRSIDPVTVTKVMHVFAAFAGGAIAIEGESSLRRPHSLETFTAARAVRVAWRLRRCNLLAYLLAKGFSSDSSRVKSNISALTNPSNTRMLG